MANAAYSEEYKKLWDACLPLFAPVNFMEKETLPLTNGYSVVADRYSGKVGDWNRLGSECSLIDHNGRCVAGWHSVYDKADFFKVITHSNGREYLIFSQDLYGYSVLDIGSLEMLHFFPEKSLEASPEGETFIWTDAAYNPIANVIAVSGCYWGYPYSVQLFTFDDPLNEHQKHIDLMDFFHNSEIDFEKWVDGDLHITFWRQDFETSSHEAVIIPQNEYLRWLCEKGQQL